MSGSQSARPESQRIRLRVAWRTGPADGVPTSPTAPDVAHPHRVGLHG